MQSSIIATLLGLSATAFAASVAERSSDAAATGITVTLCNDFHGGKPCETHVVQPGVCSNVDATLYKYVSSVKIPAKNELCTFYNGKNCNGDHITIYYPGDVDLAVNDNFDNQIVSYACSYMASASSSAASSPSGSY